MTKYLTPFSGLLLALAMTSTQAEPVMNLITINTNDPAGYAAWAKDNAESISKANNAMAMGLCSPTSGAEEMGDHYLWSFYDSQETVWQTDAMNPVVREAVAKMDVDRQIRMWDNWRIVRAAELSERGYYYNLYVETDSPSEYVNGLDRLHKKMQEEGHDVSMQIFMGDTGSTAGTIMISFGSANPAVLGRSLDARTESWFQEIVSEFEGTRKMVHGFSLICETYYAAKS